MILLNKKKITMSNIENFYENFNNKFSIKGSQGSSRDPYEFGTSYSNYSNYNSNDNYKKKKINMEKIGNIYENFNNKYSINNKNNNNNNQKKTSSDYDSTLYCSDNCRNYKNYENSNDKFKKKINMEKIGNIYDNINNKYSMNKLKKSSNDNNRSSYSSSSHSTNYKSYVNGNDKFNISNIKKLNMEKIGNFYENFNNKYGMNKNEQSKFSEFIDNDNSLLPYSDNRNFDDNAFPYSTLEDEQLSSQEDFSSHFNQTYISHNNNYDNSNKMSSPQYKLKYNTTSNISNTNSSYDNKSSSPSKTQYKSNYNTTSNISSSYNNKTNSPKEFKANFKDAFPDDNFGNDSFKNGFDDSFGNDSFKNGFDDNFGNDNFGNNDFGNADFESAFPNDNFGNDSFGNDNFGNDNFSSNNSPTVPSGQFPTNFDNAFSSSVNSNTNNDITLDEFAAIFNKDCSLKIEEVNDDNNNFTANFNAAFPSNNVVNNNNNNFNNNYFNNNNFNNNIYNNNFNNRYNNNNLMSPTTNMANPFSAVVQGNNNFANFNNAFPSNDQNQQNSCNQYKAIMYDTKPGVKIEEVDSSEDLTTEQFTADFDNAFPTNNQNMFNRNW